MNLSISNTSSAARQRYQEQVAELTRRNQERLASGRRIATAADDSAGLAIAKRLEAAVRSADQGSRNLADGENGGTPPKLLKCETRGLLPNSMQTSAPVKPCDPPPQLPNLERATNLADWSMVTEL